jgi:hypothetical protein
MRLRSYALGAIVSVLLSAVAATGAAMSAAAPPTGESVGTAVMKVSGDAALTCTIIMDDDMLVAFKTEPRPVCDFAYWG